MIHERTYTPNHEQIQERARPPADHLGPARQAGAAAAEGARPNRYGEALDAALAAAVTARRELSEAFDHFLAVAGGGAWEGRAADDWRRRAGLHRGAVLDSVDACAAACRQTRAGQPERVAAGDPRADHPGPAVPGGAGAAVSPPGVRTAGGVAGRPGTR